MEPEVGPTCLSPLSSLHQAHYLRHRPWEGYPVDLGVLWGVGVGFTFSPLDYYVLSLEVRCQGTYGKVYRALRTVEPTFQMGLLRLGLYRHPPDIFLR